MNKATNVATKEDYEVLYWHAMSKMRSGQFAPAALLLQYLYEHTQSFYMGMGAAYCHLRNQDMGNAKHVLNQLGTPPDAQSGRWFKRLCARTAL